MGYDAEGLFTYETVAQLLHLPPGEEGIWVSQPDLLDAVADWRGALATPWRYGFTIFEGGPVELDVPPIRERNGKLLMAHCAAVARLDVSQQTQRESN